MPDKRWEARCTTLMGERLTVPAFIPGDRDTSPPSAAFRAYMAAGLANAASATFTARRDLYRLGPLPSYSFKC